MAASPTWYFCARILTPLIHKLQLSHTSNNNIKSEPKQTEATRNHRQECRQMNPALVARRESRMPFLEGDLSN